MPSAKQVRIIQMAKRQLGIDDAGYRAMLAEMFDVHSCTALDRSQADQLIVELKRKGLKIVAQKPPAKKRAKGANVIHLVSREELAKIAAVAALIPWHSAEGKALFLAKRLGLKNGKVRTAGDAWKAIEGLKKLFENGMKKDHGADWWTLRYEDAGITAYIAIHRPERYK